MLVKEYGELLRDDPVYADRARRVAALTRDPVEIVAAEWKRLAPLVAMDRGATARRAFTLRARCSTG